MGPQLLSPKHAGTTAELQRQQRRLDSLLWQSTHVYTPDIAHYNPSQLGIIEHKL